MTKNPNSDALILLKQHAILMGDCVALYDPSLDVLLEYTECLQEIIGLDVKSDNIKQQWLAKVNVAINESLNIFDSTVNDTFQQFEYQINHLDGGQHQIRHISYPYLNNAGDPLILIILRDCDLKSNLESHLKIANWRDVEGSQLRHIRKIVNDIYDESKADFIMVALPKFDGIHATSLVAIMDGKFLDGLEYKLSGTPCELTVSGKICTHKDSIQSLYPEDEMLIEMGAKSYVGMPFFNDDGGVLGYLVIISKSAITDKNNFKALVDDYQPKLNRRLQLFIADQRIFELKNHQFDQSQFSLGSSPTSENLWDWSTLSKEAFNSVKEAIFISDEKGLIIQVNHAFTDITGFSEAEVIGKNPSVLSSNQHDSEFYLKMYHSLEQHGMWEGEIINKTKQGKVYSEWLYIRAIYNSEQTLTHYIAVFSDISVHKENEELLYFQANYDPLTMLPNRSLLFFTLAEEIEKLSGDDDSTLYLMHLDLNGLARINENYNYNTGDSLLLETTKRLKRILTDQVTIARISGDNFIILLRSKDAKFDVAIMADTICNSVAQPVNVEDFRVKVTSNIGVAFTKNSELSTDNFYSMAEQALLKAKQDGPNLSCIYDEALHSELKSRWELEQELAIAIEEDQFVLYYQPQIDAETNTLVGVEALVRWQHPSKGLMAPFFFIPLAEKSNQIVALGNLILKKACDQINIWQAQHQKKFTVSVNISPKQFAIESTHHHLKNIINQSNIDKSRIVLEITEDVLMTKHEDLLDMLEELRLSGIELSLDDFGTGFSSLSYLQQYPLSELKIDRSFITTLGAKPESQTIVNAIISMAKGLNLKVVAEGVETQMHRDILSQLGCDIFQGYYYAKPMSVANLDQFIN